MSDSERQMVKYEEKMVGFSGEKRFVEPTNVNIILQRAPSFNEVMLLGVWGSPFSRVEIALKLKGVKYEYLDEDLQNKSALLLKYNPVHKKVPVLVHNEKPIAESLVIVEYIDETWKHQGSPILPEDPYQRANARFWARFIDENCKPGIIKAFFEKEDREKAVDEARGLLKLLENELKDNKFFGGETIGFVDIAANLIGHWLKPAQEALELGLLSKEKSPKLWDWYDEFVSFVKETLPPTDNLIGLILSRASST
ncbi:probable glutathione S-transferase [Malus domestica]|uniref:probable glutathione S-transferase n=1 Tax=Malus domestica TaxID=3750 RepID=UPI0010AA5DC4|nr:probable glutathione S-transferase [Malus domestica]